MIALTIRRLTIYLNKHYGYVISLTTATLILKECDDVYDDDTFSEDELIDIVEKYL